MAIEKGKTTLSSATAPDRAGKETDLNGEKVFISIDKE